MYQEKNVFNFGQKKLVEKRSESRTHKRTSSLQFETRTPVIFLNKFTEQPSLVQKSRTPLSAGRPKTEQKSRFPYKRANTLFPLDSPKGKEPEKSVFESFLDFQGSKNSEALELSKQPKELFKTTQNFTFNNDKHDQTEAFSHTLNSFKKPPTAGSTKRSFHRKAASLSAEITCSSYYAGIHSSKHDPLKPKIRVKSVAQNSILSGPPKLKEPPEPKESLLDLKKKISKVYLLKHIESVHQKLNQKFQISSYDEKISHILEIPKHRNTILKIFAINSKIIHFLEQRNLVSLSFEISNFIEIGFSECIPEFLAIGLKLLSRTFFLNAEFSKSFFFSNQIRILGELLRNNLLKIDGLIGMSESCQRESFKYTGHAYDYLKKALEYSWHANDPVVEAKIYDKMGELFYMKQDIDLSVFYHRRALMPALEPKNSPQRAQGLRFVQNYWDSKDILRNEPFSKGSSRYFAIPKGKENSRNLFGKIFINRYYDYDCFSKKLEGSVAYSHRGSSYTMRILENGAETEKKFFDLESWTSFIQKDSEFENLIFSPRSTLLLLYESSFYKK